MLRIVPVSLRTANAYVEKQHRHRKPVTGHKFSIGCTNAQDELVGVAIVGRPVSRYLDDGQTLEVNRLCTDGTKKRLQYAVRRSMAGSAGYGLSQNHYIYP